MHENVNNGHRQFDLSGTLSEGADNFLYVTSIEEAYKLVAEFETR